MAGRCIPIAATVCLAVAACGGDGSGPLGPDLPDDPAPISCAGDFCDDALIAAYGYAPFYRKIVVTGGIPVISSARVADAALRTAVEVLDSMLAGRSDLRESLVAGHAYVGVMAASEVTTDIPEHAYLRNDPNTDWDQRARGLGGTLQLPITTVGEENLLCLTGDRYRGESILVHEFAHAVHLIGMALLDPAFDGRLVETYDDAVASNLWVGTYSATNHHEYWAEGVQSWFDTNQVPQPGIHNDIDTRAELAAYDPALHDLIAEVLPASAWSPACPGA